MTFEKEIVKRAVCVMVIGDKYHKQFNRVKAGFESYARRCKAELFIIDKLPDPACKRSLLAQKLLIPTLTSGFELVLFMDIDMLISASAPDIFETLPADKSFGAVVDPIGSAEYLRTWSLEKQTTETVTHNYFTERNFVLSEKLIGAINGGLFLFRPQAVASLFSDYYFSDHEQGSLSSNEEAPMAYLTQTNNLFYNLDMRYNQQLIYKLKGTDEGLEVLRKQKRFPKFIRRKYYKRTGSEVIPALPYRRLVEKQLNENYFVHFAGGYPFDFAYRCGGIKNVRRR